MAYKTIKPIIKYFGGKGNMVNKIIELFPSKDTYNTFIDAFGGSASVLLAKEPNGAEIYNDLEENVYSLHKVISDSILFTKFKSMCDLAFFSEQLRTEYIKDLKINNLDIIDRAFKFFYVNRTSYNGTGGFTTNCSIRRNMAKATSDYLSVIDRLPEIYNRLSSVIISNRDAIKLITDFDTSNVFMYLDPPYYQDTRTSVRYKVDMSNSQQENFINILLNMKDAKILVSGYICDLYEKLCESGWERIDYEINTVNTKRVPKSKIESLYKNY